MFPGQTASGCSAALPVHEPVVSDARLKRTGDRSDRFREVRNHEAFAGSIGQPPFETNASPDGFGLGSQDSRRTLTRQALVRAIVDRCEGVSRREAKLLLDAVIEEMIGSLAHVKSLRLRNFRTFVIRAKSARPGRNPRTGANVLVSARQVVVFRAAAQLKAVVVNGAAPTNSLAKGHAKASRLIDLERRARSKRIDQDAVV